MKVNNIKELQYELAYTFFMNAPHPMAITQIEDGTYIEINKAAVQYMGLPRAKLIQRKSIEIGHMPVITRQMIIEEIKIKGFARNIELEARVKNNEVLYLLFNVFPIKSKGKIFFLSVVTDIAKSKHKKDVLFRLRLPDTSRVKEKLKQFKFSPRQEEVAFLASCGYSNSEIAKKMCISEHTVKDHMKEVNKVIGVHRRSEISPKILNWR